MRYQVTFRKRFNQDGDGSDAPQVLLNLPEGVIEEGLMVEQTEPDNLHVEEKMEEDDDLLPFGSETWEYEIADGREAEFEQALEESGVVMEYDQIEDQLEG